MSAPVTYRRPGRNRRTVMAVLVAALILYGLWSIGTQFWILAVLSIFAIPALTDLVFNPLSEFTLDDAGMRWKNSAQEGDVPLSRLRSVRFDTRWDISVRVTLTMVDGSTLRLPPDVTPPHQILEEALRERGIDTERHHFRVM